MAVTEVTILRQPRLSSVKKSGTMGFRVKFDSFTKYSVMYAEACAAVDPSSGVKVPQEGTNLDGDLPSEGDPLCTNIVAQLHEEQNLWWNVIVTFGGSDNPESQGGGGSFDIPPWNKAKVYKFGHTNIQKRITVDAAGKPMLNSAGEAFDESVFTPVAVRTITATWVVKKGSWNPFTGSSFINTTNSNSFRTAGYNVPAGKAFCKANDGVLTTATVNGSEKAIWQRTATWDVIVGDGDWNGMVLDQGHNQLALGVAVPIRSKNGTKYTSPQLLNGGGGRLRPSRGGANNYPPAGASQGLPIDAGNSSSDRVWLTYVPYEESNHGQIL